MGEIADRGPLERGTPTPPEPRARDAREFQRQAAWRASAVRVIEEVRQPLDADDAALDESLDEPGVAPGRGSVARAAAATLEPSAAPPRRGAMAAVPARAPEVWAPSESDLAAWAAARDEDDDEDEDDDDEIDESAVIRLGDGAGEAPLQLDTLHVWPFGISRNRLEQAVRELRLPVVVVREAEEAEAVITLRNFYKQKAPGLREAEARASRSSC